MKGILIILLLLSVASAQLPSDLIERASLPGSISLSGATSGSAKAIDALNPEFGLRGPQWVMKNIAHYTSEPTYEVQDENATDTTLLNFSNNVSLLPASTGNVSNQTVDVTNLSELIYL